MIELMIVVAIIGILAAIAIPNFVKFQARSKSAEAKSNLKALYSTQRSYFAEHDTHSSTLDTVGFAPERGNRYAYESINPPTVHQTRTGVSLGAAANFDAIDIDSLKNTGVTGAPTTVAGTAGVTFYPDTGHATLTTIPSVILGPTGDFVALAIGNIDSEPLGLDEWIISSQVADITATPCARDNGGPSGNPFQIFDDVSCP